MGIRTCPRCSEPLHQGHIACSHCQFSLDHIDSTYGIKRVRLQRLVDADQIIDPGQTELIHARMDRFESDFPQLVFLTYLADLPGDTNLRELGFWLINRAIIDSPRSNQNAILLCVNTSELSASLTLGYLPEQYVTEETLSSILAAGSPFISERRFATLVGYCLNSLTKQFRQAVQIS